MEQPWEELPKKFTPALKKRVSKDWHQFFPELGLWKIMSYKKIIGPLLCGISIQNASSGENYIPTFCVHNLSNELDFLTATLSHRLATVRTGSDDWLKLRWHDKNYREAAQRMQQQALLPLEGPISLEQVLQAYKLYVERNPWPSIISHAQDPAMIAAWAGEPERAREALEWGYGVFKSWSTKMQEAYGGTTAWRAKMEETIADPEKLRQIAREQIVFHKLEKLPYQDFTDTAYKEREI